MLVESACGAGCCPRTQGNQSPRHARCPRRSANVYRAFYNGEIIAAKEIEVERSPQMLEAFLTEALRLQVRQWGAAAAALCCASALCLLT